VTAGQREQLRHAVGLESFGDEPAAVERGGLGGLGVGAHERLGTLSDQI
jgi:hypothetical protein